MIPFRRNSFSFGNNPFSYTPDQQQQMPVEQDRRNFPTDLTQTYMRNPPIPQPNPTGNFGQAIPLPPPQPASPRPPIVSQQQPVPQPQPRNFVEEFEKVNRERPNRLAYQKGVEEGAPRIERSKWARLGAALGAGAVATGGDAGLAYNMGRAALEAPQNKATAEYERKMKGLGSLANMEENDVANRIKALETERSEYWNNRNATRSDAENERAERLAAEQIRTSQANSDRLNWITYDNPQDGMMHMKNQITNEDRVVGQTGKTTQQQIDDFAAKLTKQYEIQDPHDEKVDKRQHSNKMAEIGAQNAGALANTEAAGRSREAVAEANNNTKKAIAASRLRERAATMSPDNVSKNIVLDLAVAIDEGRIPPDSLEYLNFDENGAPSAPAGMFGNPATAAKITQEIARSINQSRNPSPSAALGNTSSGRPNPTTAPPVDPNTLPKNADGTVTVTSPDGKQTRNFSPAEAARLVAAGGKVKGMK